MVARGYAVYRVSGLLTLSTEDEVKATSEANETPLPPTWRKWTKIVSLFDV